MCGHSISIEQRCCCCYLPNGMLGMLTPQQLAAISLQSSLFYSSFFLSSLFSHLAASQLRVEQSIAALNWITEGSCLLLLLLTGLSAKLHHIMLLLLLLQYSVSYTFVCIHHNFICCCSARIRRRTSIPIPIPISLAVHISIHSGRPKSLLLLNGVALISKQWTGKCKAIDGVNKQAAGQKY